MNNAILFRRHTMMLAVAVCAALAAGCASNQNAALLHADKLYSENRADAALMKNEKAAGYMAAASKALAKAKHNHQLITSFDEPLDPREVDSMAYVSEQNVLAAKAIVSKDAAEGELAKLKAERDSAMLAKQERDATAEKKRKEEALAAAAAQQERDRAALALASALESAKKSGAEIQESANELKITFRNLTFDTNQASVKPQFQATLDQLAGALQQRYPAAKLEIRGYTDSTGSDQHNAKLSEQRAVAVKTFLIGKGLSAERLASRGLGETNPIASNDTPQGRALNRRVELSVLGTQGQ